MKDLLNRITFDNEILKGKPIIRGMRISVELIIELLAKGSTENEILEDSWLMKIMPKQGKEFIEDDEPGDSIRLKPELEVEDPWGFNDD